MGRVKCELEGEAVTGGRAPWGFYWSIEEEEGHSCMSEVSFVGGSDTYTRQVNA